MCNKDGNPANNRLDNLRWDTHRANVDDAIRHGSYGKAKGSRQGRAKLTEADIPIIRLLPQDGWNHSQIAERYGVSRSLISGILRGEKWTHV